VAKSFERIHRANLVGMGVLPLQFRPGEGLETLGLHPDDSFDIVGLRDPVQPGQDVRLRILREGAPPRDVVLIARVDTPMEADYYRHGGILPYVLRELLAEQGAA
jgi:aconitate hydratase